MPRYPILGTISDLSATVGDGQVVLEWTAPVGGTGYHIQYKLSSSGTWLDFTDPDEPPPYYDSSPPSVTGLTNDSAYDFRVIVNDTIGSETTSNTASATPTATAGFGTVNDLAVKATQTDTTLEFEWTQVADDLGNAAKYAVRIRTPSLDSGTWGDAFGSEIAVDTNLAIGVTKSVQFTGLTAGTDYEAMLIPFRGPTGNADAFGDFSNSAAGTTTGTTTLGTIADLAASPGDTQVGLTWSAAANATSHQPEYKLSSSGTWLQFGSPLGGSANSVTVTGLTNGSPYDFRVEAGDGVTTTTSNVDSATPTASTDLEPSGMTQQATNDFSTGSMPGDSAWTFNDSPSSVVASIVTDSGAPSGDTNVEQLDFPDGLTGGGGTDNVRPTTVFQKKYCYIRFHFKPSTNYYLPVGGAKICYFGGDENQFGNFSYSNENYIRVVGEGAGATLRLQFVNQRGSSLGEGVPVIAWNSSNNELSPSSSDVVVTRDVWNKVELYWEMGTKDVADDKIVVALNGTAVFKDSDQELTHAGHMSGLKNEAIWSSTNHTTPNAFNLRFDDFYISVSDSQPSGGLAAV